MKKFLALSFVLLFICSGCASVIELEKPANVFSLQQYPANQIVFVALVADERPTNEAGTLLMTPYVADEQLPRLLRSLVQETLNIFFQVNIIPVTENTSTSALLRESEGRRAHGGVDITLIDLKLKGEDPQREEVEATLDFQLDIYNSEGKKLGSETFSGTGRRRLGRDWDNRSVGKLVELAIFDALNEMKKSSVIRSTLLRL